MRTLMILMLCLLLAAAARAQPYAAPFTQPGCTVGTASAQCLAAGAMSHSVTMLNAGTGAAIACSWGGTAALNTATSFTLQAGQALTVGPTTAGVPPGALNCIAAAAGTPLYVLGW